MMPDTERQYAERLNRYVTAMRGGCPDRVPIRPFVAEFAAKYAGYTCQEVSHDYEKAFAAARECAADFEWDAVVGNMVYVWTGLTQAIGLKYYGVPGIDVPPDTGFQYREPAESDAFMKADEYDALIADPTGFLLETWLPRVSSDIVAPGAPATSRSHLAFLKGGMAMLQYFSAFGPQGAALRAECGMPGAIAGILKAPLDIIGDKLRGYLGLTADLIERPEKVLRACEALAPHLCHVAMSGADPDNNAPVGFWMHRGGVPFVTMDQFEGVYWPTLRPIIETLWSQGHQTLFYAEGNWNAHLERFAELPERSIVFHIDQSDPFEAKRVLGDRFCLSGGMPNAMLSYGTTDEVRAQCRKLIDGVAKGGGYIMDASAIIQNDATIENVRAMTEFILEHGVYSQSAPAPPQKETPGPPTPFRPGAKQPGICVPWEEKRAELPQITGDEALIRRVWENNEALAYTFIWHCLLSF
jgi:hypothetical protein